MRPASLIWTTPRLTSASTSCGWWFYLALVVVCGAGTAAPVSGMGLQREAHVVARSADGQSVLYEEYLRGPEGGGTTTYLLSGSAGSESFVVSSDLSPGGSSKPQRITAADCALRLGELAKLLSTRGFLGVTVHPERCPRKSRSGLITKMTTKTKP